LNADSSLYYTQIEAQNDETEKENKRRTRGKLHGSVFRQKHVDQSIQRERKEKKTEKSGAVQA